MNRSPRSILLALALLALAVFLPLSPAKAQDTLRPAAVVNDDVISMIDLAMRMRLTMLATGVRDSAEARDQLTQQVLESLVVERLQYQEAERLGISVGDEQVREALNNIAQQNSMTLQQFAQFLQQNGVLPTALSDQIRGQLLWGSIVQRRLRPRVDIGEEEIDAAIAQAAGRNKERLLQEIFLPVDTALDTDRVRQQATTLLVEIQNGASFAAIAQQFSQAASAAQGGDMGWIIEGQLAPEVEQALNTAPVGTILGPIETLSGFYIIGLRDQRSISQSEVRFSIMQLLVPLSENRSDADIAEAQETASELRAELDGCLNVAELNEEIESPGPSNLGDYNLSELPSAVQSAVSTLGDGESSEPTITPAGVVVYVVCDRDEAGLDREEVEQRLMDQRLEVLSRRYLQDLRRSAQVDIRLE